MELGLRRFILADQHFSRTFQARIVVPAIQGSFKVSAHTLTVRSPYKKYEADFAEDGDSSVLNWIMICKEERTPVCGLLGLLRSPYRLVARRPRRRRD